MRRGVLACASAVVWACGDPTPPARTGWQADTDGLAGVRSGSDLERFFPLVDGHIYHYRTESLGDTPAPPGMLMMKVHRSSATAGELRRPAGTQRFEYGQLGIATTTKTGSPAFVIKAPLDPATRWLGPHGGTTRLGAQDVAVTTQAGSFTGCLTTVEERQGDVQVRVSTTLCPDVGIVALEVQSGGAVERAELVYHGPPVDLGSDVTKRIE